MDDRLILHAQLETTLPTFKLYFAPLPSNLILEYPCIVYKHTNLDPIYANNGIYETGTTFEVVMMRNDDFNTEITKQMLTIPGSRYIRGYTVDSIRHDVYEITTH